MVNKDVTETIDLASGLTINEDYSNANHDDKLGNTYIGTDHLKYNYDVAHLMLPSRTQSSMYITKIVPVILGVFPGRFTQPYRKIQ